MTCASAVSDAQLITVGRGLSLFARRTGSVNASASAVGVGWGFDPGGGLDEQGRYRRRIPIGSIGNDGALDS